MSSIVSPRPSCVLPASMTTGWPPSSATPISKDSRVRVDGFSKTIATALPASGFGPSNAVRLELGGEVEDLRLLGGREVVVGQEVTRHALGLILLVPR